MGSLSGVGFTVSLLIGDLAYTGTPRNDRVTTAVLIASLLASVIAAVAFRIRVRQRVRAETDSTAIPGAAAGPGRKGGSGRTVGPGGTVGPEQGTPHRAVPGEEMRNGRDSARRRRRGHGG